MKALPSSAADLIPSIALDRLLAQREAAVAQLTTIAAATASYMEIGRSIWPPKDEGCDSVNYTFREPVDLRPSGRGAYLRDEKWLADGIKAVDASIWDHLLSESGLWTFFDKKAREEWRKQIEERATPALNAENIRATFESLYSQRGSFFERGVIELFRSLSWNYKTNCPVMFGKRIVVRGLTSGFGHNTDRLDDLDRAFHLLDGKPEPDHRSSIGRQLPYSFDPKASTVETPYFRLKVFKNRNGHVEFLRPDLVAKLNEVLAKNCPNALPHSMAEAA